MNRTHVLHDGSRNVWLRSAGGSDCNLLRRSYLPQGRQRRRRRIGARTIHRKSWISTFSLWYCRTTGVCFSNIRACLPLFMQLRAALASPSANMTAQRRQSNTKKGLTPFKRRSSRGKPSHGCKCSHITFFSLPREIRDAIYEECLVSTKMIDLSNLGTTSRHKRFQKQALGLLPNILRICRQIEREASEILYGANTFFVDLQPMWDYGKERLIRPVVDSFERSRHPYACLECSNQAFGFPRQLRGLPSTRQRVENCHPVTTWSPRVHQVRRLHVALRPFSWLAHSGISDIKNWLCRLAYKEDRELVWACNHSQQFALPKLQSLDLLIMHIGKMPIVLIEQQPEYELSMNFSIHAWKWRASLRAAMAREIGWLLTFAKQAAKVIVVPESGYAKGLTGDQRARLDLSCKRPKRGSLPVDQQILAKVPQHFLRSGNLGHLTSSKKKAYSLEDVFLRHQDYRVEQYEAIDNARQHGDMAVLPGSETVIFDSI